MPTSHRHPDARASLARSAPSFVGLAAGALAGVVVVLAVGPAVAERPGVEARSVFDVTHVPPLLTRPGERVELRYDATCAGPDELVPDAPCELSGTVFVRAGGESSFRALPLAVDPGSAEGRLVTSVPRELSGRTDFDYYAVLRSRTTGDELTLPPGGAAAPHRSVPMSGAIQVSLGAHRFGDTRKADARVAEARWGSGAGDVGLEGGRNLPPSGASSFDVDAQGAVYVLDHVRRRLLAWRTGDRSPRPIAVGTAGTLGDLAVARDGTMYVLESVPGGAQPVLRRLAADGRLLAVAELAERTAGAVRIGPKGPVVQLYPSGQWFPVEEAGRELPAAGQLAGARSARPAHAGRGVTVLRRAGEIRVALEEASGTRRFWRVASDTPIGEVQLAEPFGAGLVLVARVYADDRDEFVVLVLDGRGVVRRWWLDSAGWAESAPLARFRLSGSGLYRLGSTPTAMFVERFDLAAR